MHNLYGEKGMEKVAAELNEKLERLSELNALLNMDEKGNETIMADEDIGREGNSTDSRDAVEEKELPETADRIHKPSILERLKQEKAIRRTVGCPAAWNRAQCTKAEGVVPEDSYPGAGLSRCAAVSGRILGWKERVS